MTFLLTTKPNWIIPVFRQTGFIIEYKRFPADYMWRPFIDLSEVIVDLTDINDAIEALDTAVIAAQSTADTALTTATIAESQANIGIADAATAYGLAETASIDAANALALASAGCGGRRATIWMDEAHYINGTPTLLVTDTYLGNFIRFTTTDLAEALPTLEEVRTPERWIRRIELIDGRT